MTENIALPDPGMVPGEEGGDEAVRLYVAGGADRLPSETGNSHQIGTNVLYRQERL